MTAQTPLERFWSKVSRSGPDDCWEWTGGRNRQGYGVFYLANQRHYAHRWIVEQNLGRSLQGLRTGDSPGTEDACHRCDNPPCVNPAHLYVGTRKRNVADAVERARLWQLQITSCPQGHPYDEANTEIRRSGARRCRTCARAADKRRKGGRTTCKNGHPLSGDNLLLCKNGTRKCRICDAERLRKRHSRPRCL